MSFRKRSVYILIAHFRLTTVAQPTYEIGKQAMQLLVRKMASNKDELELGGSQLITLSSQLRIRDSTAPPPRDPAAKASLDVSRNFSLRMGKGGVLTPPLPTLLIVPPSRAPRSLFPQAARGARRTEGWEPLCGGVKTPPFRSPDSKRQSVGRVEDGRGPSGCAS